jgi:chromosome segregation ATPase
MGVKLLQKSEIASLKAKAQGREVQEGVKIATRVDGLRTLWAKTESDFELYKTSTLAAIQDEIVKANEEKESITSTLRALKAEYEQLLPEIPMKRAELAAFEKRLTAWEKKLVKKEDSVALGEIDIAEFTQKAEFAKVRNEDNERISRNLLIQANKKKQDADEALSKAQNIQATAEKEKKDMEQSLSLREMAIKAQEQELLTNQMNLASDRTILAIEKVRVNDMRQTLERSLERLKQGRLA